MKAVILQLDLHDQILRNRAMKKVICISGVDSVSVDKNGMTMTAIGNVDPVEIVRTLRKLLPTDVILVGQAEAEQPAATKTEEGKDKNPKGSLTPLPCSGQMQPSQGPLLRSLFPSPRPRIQLPKFKQPYNFPYGMYGEHNLGLGLISALPTTNLRESIGRIPSLEFDLEIGMNSHHQRKEIGMSVPDGRYNGVLQIQSPKTRVISCIQLEEDKKKVGDRISDITEQSIQTQVTSCLASFEKKPDHCNSMNIEELYISKTPSLHFCGNNFVSMSFPYCKHLQLWKGEGQLLVSLKYLDAKHSNLVWIPNLSKAQKLESLNLEGCADLVEVSSIQYLKKLQHLNLKGCQSLKRLPSLIRLKLLKTLDLSHCSNLTRLPPSLGCLPTLCELNLKNCEKLENLPRSVIHLMKSLETLNISGCSKMLESISRVENAAPSLTQPPFALHFVPSSGIPQEENLPINSTDIPISKSTEDTCLEPQQITAVQQDSGGDLALQDVYSDLQDIREEKAIESEDDDSMMIPLIMSLLSKLRTALSIPSFTDSSHASSSSSQDYNALPIEDHTEDSISRVEVSKILAAPYIEDQQQLCKDDDHEDAKSEEKPLSPNAEPIYCQVEDCEIDLRIKNPYHQQHKICEVHSNASEALVGNILQRFCHQCCRFHDLIDFDEGERNCRTRLAGYHQKQRRHDSSTTSTKGEHSSPETDLYTESNVDESDESAKCLLPKRTRTSDAATEQNQPTHPLVNQLSFSSQDWDEANAIRNIEEDILALIDQLSSCNDEGKEVPESVMAWVAEMEQSVPEMVRSMKNAKAEATVITGKKKKMEVMLVLGELELRLLDMELSRITEEEDEIEAELQRLMNKKKEILQH